MKFLPALFFLFCSAFAHAQTEVAEEKNNGNAVVINKSGSLKSNGLIYNTSLSFGLKASTSGFGMMSDLTKRITNEKDRVYYFELNFLKHPKELKKINEYTVAFPYDSPRPFVYGKKNSFFALKAGYGNKFLLGQKAEKNGYEIKFNYAFGPSLGFVKPYFLDVWYEEDGDAFIISEKYTSETESDFLNATSIYGYSGFNKGLNEISLLPGGFGKAGINFDWASYDDFVKAVEAGIGGEFYIKDVPMMIIENNKPYFVYLYLSLQLGKKW
ncbi:MAG: hypothetical protein ACKVPJ_02790 [Chitinophagales bacterium]